MKHLFVLFISIIVWISSVSFVFWSIVMNFQNITPDTSLSKVIFLNSSELNSTVLGFKHEWDISDYVFQSTCKTKTEFLWKENFTSFFKITFLDFDCQNPYVSLKKWDKIVEKSTVKLDIESDLHLYTSLVDISDEALQNLESDINNKIWNKTPSVGTGWVFNVKDIPTYQRTRKIQELLYKQNFIQTLLEKRQKKYIVPVEWRILPIGASKIPNAWRPYRSWYTDGIHHSWDIDAKVWTSVIALDDGIIVRVVDNWNWGTLSNLRKGNSLKREDMERNLDILRGNQVWVKTMKGDVVMYNHLETITSDLKEWQFISRWMTLGTVWISGVPDATYEDSHLDFSIMENPYIAGKAWKYEPEEYMFWDWKMKGKSKDYILEHQYDLFEK